MVDDVDIKNVGGKYGVASEATMQLILAQLGGSNSSAGSRAQRLAAQSQDRSTRANNDAAASSNVLVKGFKVATGAIDSLGTIIFKSGNSISEFSKTLLGDGNMLFRGINRFTAFIDDNVDSLRELSSVGASFNNSIFDMMGAAASGSMSFDNFSTMIKMNSEVLAKLGGTVSSGAEGVAQFTKQVRKSDFGTKLMGMGMTINDINQGLVDYLDIQMMSGKKINLRDNKLMKGGEAYLLQLDELARITGKQRELISKDLTQQLQDAGIRNQYNSLNEEQQKNFSSTLEVMNTQMPAFADAFVDMADGVSQSDMAKALDSQIPELKPLMEKWYSGALSPEMLQSGLKRLQPQLVAFSKQFKGAGYAAMKSGSGIAQAIVSASDSIYQLTEFANQDLAKSKIEQDKRNAFTEAFAAFAQTIQNVRDALTYAFLRSKAFDALKELGGKVTDFFSKVMKGPMTDFNTAMDTISNYLLGKNGLLTVAIQNITTQFDSFAGLVEKGGFLVAFETKLGELADWVGKWFKEIFFGKDVESKDRQGTEHQKGLLAQMADGLVSAFNQFWEGPYGTAMANTIGGYFEKLVDGIILGINSATGGMFFGGAASNILLKQAQAGTTLTPEQKSVITEQQYEDRTSLLGEATNATVESALALSDLFGDTLYAGIAALGGPEMDSDLAGMFNRWTRGEPQLGTPAAPTQPTGQSAGVELDPSAGFAKGTTGFQNFGTVTGTSLHGVEAVVPRNTMAGNMLAKSFDNDWNNPKPIPTQSSQENTVKYIIQLNSTMLMVLEELRKGTDLDKRTLKGVRSLSGDLNRGI